MNIHDMTEQAYKNGYDDGIKDASKIERIRELTKVVYDKEIAEAKSEARKEFAERLKCRASILCDKVTGLPISYTISNYDFHNLLKEMESERDAEE